MKKALIIIPTYNEAGTIKQLIDEIITEIHKIENWQIEILVVDSSSPDGTEKIVRNLIKKYPILHIISTKKEGLGKAYIHGFNYAFAHLQPYVVFEMDADFSHDPKMIPKFLEKIEKGADFVIGSRYIKDGSIPSDWQIHRKIFSILGNIIVRFGFMKLQIADWSSGYRAMKIWIVKSALSYVQKYSGYVFQVAILDQALKSGAKIQEIPIQFKDRKSGISKINSWQYISQTIWYVLSHSSFIKFVVVGFIGFGIDFGFAYGFINVFNLSKPLANGFSAEIAIISNFFLNNFWSFKHKKIKGGIFSYIKKLVLFNLVSSGSIVIQSGGMYLAIKIFGEPYSFIWIIYKILIIACLIIPYSYILYNKVIWKNK